MAFTGLWEEMQVGSGDCMAQHLARRSENLAQLSSFVAITGLPLCRWVAMAGVGAVLTARGPSGSSWKSPGEQCRGPGPRLQVMRGGGRDGSLQGPQMGTGRLFSSQMATI